MNIEKEQTLFVDESQAGKRVDMFISRHSPDYISRAKVQSLIKQGKVLINGNKITATSMKIKRGDKIDYFIPPPIEPNIEPQNIKLAILYEDESIIVIEKSAGMVVHPAVGNYTDTLVNALLYHCKGQLSGIGGVKRPGIVHRLDKDTSGILVVAKTYRAHLHLQKQFAEKNKENNLQRIYKCLVWGVPSRKKDSIATLIGRHKTDRLKQAVLDISQKHARHAITDYEVLQIFEKNNVSLLQCRLQTGRTHQIRVHLSHLGYPLLGDKLYGSHFATKAVHLSQTAQQALLALNRQALHACLLQFQHPKTNEILKFESAFPKDIESLFLALE